MIKKISLALALALNLLALQSCDRAPPALPPGPPTLDQYGAPVPPPLPPPTPGPDPYGRQRPPPPR